MLETQQAGNPSIGAVAAQIAPFGAVRDFILDRPEEFVRTLGELLLIGSDVQLFSDPHARADLLAIDSQGVAVVVAVEREGEHSLLEHGLMCAGLVAGWQPRFFFVYPSTGRAADLHAFLQVPEEQINRQQRVVLVARSHDFAIYSAAQWLARRHGIEIWCVQGRIDPASGSLELTRLGPESFGQEARPVETVRLVFPQPSATELQPWSDTGSGLPLQPVLDPATGAVTGVCRLQTIWSPDPDTAATRSIEGRLQQILDEELRKAGVAKSAVVETATGQLAATAEAQRTRQPVAEVVEEVVVVPATLEPSFPRPFDARESRSRKVLWLAGVMVLAAVLVPAGMLLRSLRRPAPEPDLQPAAKPKPPSPAPVRNGISNSIRDAATGRPIPGARLYYAGRTLRADRSGEFQLQPAEGEQRLLVKAAGYRQTTSSIDAKEPIRLEPIDVRGYYLSHSHVADLSRRESILRLIQRTSANAVILGVKDVTGSLNVAVNHPLARELGAAGRAEAVELARQVAAWKAQGVYTIALLALFKDDLLARGKPEFALKSAVRREPLIDPDGIAWADPSSKPVWEYNIEVAKAAAAAGFDEIQFDFIRYPAESPSDEGGSPAEYARRLGTLVSFLRAANHALDPYNVYVSATVFGSVCAIPVASVIGQKIEEFAAQLDYVSPMLYPSYFEPGPRYPDPLRQSYQLVYENLRRAARRLEGDSVKLRPWLQNFPDSASPGEPLETDSIRKQVKAAEDAGAGGWMLWDSRNTYRNTAEAITLLQTERGRAQAPRPETGGGSSLLLVGRLGEGEPPTSNPGQQFRLVGVLLLAGCCLGVLYAAVRAAWLFHKWTRTGPSRRPEISSAAGARGWLRERVSWASLPRWRYDDSPLPGRLRRVDSN